MMTPAFILSYCPPFIFFISTFLLLLLSLFCRHTSTFNFLHSSMVWVRLSQPYVDLRWTWIQPSACLSYVPQGNRENIYRTQCLHTHTHSRCMPLNPSRPLITTRQPTHLMLSDKIIALVCVHDREIPWVSGVSRQLKPWNHILIFLIKPAFL